MIFRDLAAPRAGQFASLLVFAAVVCVSGVAHAQDTDACIAASEKAVSLRKAEKLVESRVPLATCAAPACPDLIRASCQQRLIDVNEAIPSIVFFAKDRAGHDLDEVKLTIDGSPYANRLGGVAIALDPGEHEFRFELEGERPVVRRFVLHQSEQNRREQIVIGGPSAEPPTAPKATAPIAPISTATPVLPAAGAPAEHSLPPPIDGGASSHGSAQGPIGLVIGAAGVAGLGAGAVFGLLSLSAHQNYEKNCGSNLNVNAPANSCNQAGASGEADAAKKGDLSTIFFAAGGALVAVGAVVFFTAPKGAVSAQVGIAPGGLIVSGRF
ncbi:MAG: hypothetical protein ABSC94_28320 [Polyangiaceae bacterium]|jgi:hypothetical protein